MITTLNTTAPASSSTASSSGSGNTILILLGLAVVGFIAYKYLTAEPKKEETTAKE